MSDLNITFICIGFQKCGTSSLRSFLNSHPDISVPEKEIEPFAAEPFVEKNKDIVLEEVIDPNAKVKGLISPHYSVCEYITSAINIRNNIGQNLKLITIERERSNRAYSAWNMARVVGLEKRSFVDAIRECLNLNKPPNVECSKWLLDSYVYAGNYNFIRNSYYTILGCEILHLNLFDPPLVNARALSQFLHVDINKFGEFPHINKRLNLELDLSNTPYKEYLEAESMINKYYSKIGEI